MPSHPKAVFEIDEYICSELAELRLGASMSLRSLSAASGVKFNRVAIIMRGDGAPATVGEVDVISRALGVRLEDVVARAAQKRDGTFSPSEWGEASREMSQSEVDAARELERYDLGARRATSEGDSYAEPEDQPDTDPDSWGA